MSLSDPAPLPRPAQTGLVVEEVGAQALVQDAGRPGLAALGVPPSGAADRLHLAQGNRLLGNPPDAAGVEVLLGGLAVRAQRACLVAVTGAAAAVTVDGVPAPFGAVVALGAGRLLRIGPATTGLRCYLTVRGGLAASAATPAELGSLSTDPTSGLGPAPLRPGDRLAVGAGTGEPTLGLAVPAFGVPGALVLPATWGPREDHLSPQARRLLGSSPWTVSADTDRVGVRLDGPVLETAGRGELPSEGVVRGAVQLPPSGQPVVFLADHPTTGGYPVVAVVDDAATDVLAQLRPGAELRLALRRVSWAAGPV